MWHEALEAFEWLLRFLPIYRTHVWKGRQGLRALERNDCATALRLWRSLSSDGDAEANYQLGLLYASGRCVDQDMTKAEELIVKAAPSYHRAAIKWLKQQARAGNANAQFLLADLVFNGVVNLSIMRHVSGRRAEKLLDSASKQGHADAQGALAMWNFGGYQQERSRFARFFLNRRWSARLFFNLPPMNQAKAMSLLEKSARMGSLQAMYCLADFYERGFDFAPDPAKAFHWMMEAAQGGYVDAQLALARYYWDGVGTQQDREAAGRWFGMAKAQITKDASCDAHCDLVWRLMEGVGCERDLVQAYYWAKVTDRRFPGQVAKSEGRKLRRMMTEEQMQEAERLLRNDDLAA